MPVNPNGYPLDLTGLAPSNFITNEVHLLTTPRDRLFVPSAGPFFHIGSQIRNGVTNQILLPNTDYKLLHLHKPAAIATGANIYTVVYIINETIPHVVMDYHVVGGIHGETADVIRTLLESFPLPNDGDSVSWGQIIGVPVQFTPAEHLHHIDEIYNFNDVVSVLEQIRIAILAGDGPAINAIYQYFHQYLLNADYATHNDLESVTSAVPFFEIKTFPDYATMRQATTMINDAPAVYACLGRDNMFDGNGRLFLWQIASNVADDNDFTVRPNHIPAINNGRFIAFQRNEKDLNRLALSLQRKINYDGSVDDSLFENGHVVVGDCNNYVHTGTYWVGDANVIANTPFSWCVLKVDNISVDAAGSDSIGEVCHTFYNGVGGKATRFRYYDAGTTSFLWTAPVFYAVRTGDANYNFSVKNATQPDHAVNLGQLSVYGGNQDVSFLVDDPTLAYHAVNMRSIVKGQDCNVGVCARYFGQTSVLLPCYIGDDSFIQNSSIFINGRYRNVDLQNIAGLYSFDYHTVGPNGLAFIYLKETGNVLSLLVSGVEPDNLLTGNMTTSRKPLSRGGADPLTSDTIFLAVVQRIDGNWRYIRNWFQDPGLFEHEEITETSRDYVFSRPTVSGPVARLSIDDDVWVNSTSTMFWSSFFGKNVQELWFMAWEGELVEIELNADMVIHVANAFTSSARVELEVSSGQSGATVCRMEGKMIHTAYPNAYDDANGTHMSLRDVFKAPQTGSYVVRLRGYIGSTYSGRLYIYGHHSGNISRGRLMAKLNQYHAYRNLTIGAFQPNGVSRILTIDNTTTNINLADLYIATYGPFANTPLLTDVELLITNGAIVGSTDNDVAGVVIDGSWPAGIQPIITVDFGCYLVGKGGRGGHNSGNKNGLHGSDAIYSLRSFKLNLFGTVAGGGGGGAGGAAAYSGATGSDGGPGGGGAGYQAGVAGNRYRTSPIGGDDTAAAAGNDGTLTTGGLGGQSYIGGPRNENTSQGSHGGPGGALGQPGGNAYGGFAHTDINGAVGAAGAAVRVIGGQCTIINGGGQTLGAVISWG